MASPKIEVVFFYDSSGLPLIGLTPTFDTYKDDLGTNLSQPTINEIGGGAYKFTTTFTAGRGIVYIVNGGSTAFPQRQAKFLRPEDYNTDDITTLMTIQTGRWEIKTTGPDANRLIIYDADDTTILKKFDLFDQSGTPSATNTFQRVPV